MRLVRATSVASCVLVFSLAGTARGYPWMIRHHYSGCATCHADPSGAGLLTDYGRAQSELLLRTNYSKVKSEEASDAAKFMWSVPEKLAGPLPGWLLLGGSYRGAKLRATTPRAIDSRFLQMAADLYGQVSIGPVRLNGSIGYVPNDALPAAITHRAKDAGNLVSRLYWIGMDFQDQAWLVRAGRLNLPFGLRNVEHTSWVRSETRTDINTGQQHGVAVAYTGEKFRGEVMGFLGNFQIHPADFREEGFSGLLEYSITQGASVGLSSLLAQTQRDLSYVVSQYRQAHGLFARYAPIEPVVILAEGDLLVRSPVDQPRYTGYTGLFQVDLQVIQGLHFMPIIEVLRRPEDQTTTRWGEWLTLDWFFAPHCDVRLDFVNRTAPIHSKTYLVQFHAFL